MAFSALVGRRLARYRGTLRSPTGRCAQGRPLPRVAELLRRWSATRRRRRADDPTLINAVRRAIRERCVAAAAWEPGLYRLAAPTGAGKTLAAMTFALHHAVRRSATPRGRRAVHQRHRADCPACIRMCSARRSAGHHSAIDAERSGQLWATLAAERTGTSCRRDHHRPALREPVIQPPVREPASCTTSPARDRRGRGAGAARSAPGVHHGVLRCLPALTAANRRAEHGKPSRPRPAAAALEQAHHLVPDYAEHFDRLRRVDWSPAVEPWSAKRVAEELHGRTSRPRHTSTPVATALRVLRECPPGTWHPLHTAVRTHAAHPGCRPAPD